MLTAILDNKVINAPKDKVKNAPKDKIKGTNSKVKDAPKDKVKDAKDKVINAPKKDAPKESKVIIKDKVVGTKKDNTVFLVDGVKGGQLHKCKIETNQAVKKDMRTFSSAKRFCIANDKKFLSSFKNFNADNLTDKTLLPLRTEKEKISSDKNGFSAWLFMSLVKRYYAKK